MFLLGTYNSAEDTGRLRVSAAEISRYWAHTASRHPLGKNVVGFAEQANPLGVWGDDGRFNRAGQKLVLFTVNALLHNSSRDSDHDSEVLLS